jgi:hypothetical protein
MVSYYNPALSMFPTPGPTPPSVAPGGSRNGGGGNGVVSAASSAASAAAAAVAAQASYFPGYGYPHPHQQFSASQYPGLSDLNSNMYTAAAQFAPSAAGAAAGAFDVGQAGSWAWHHSASFNSCRNGSGAAYDAWQQQPAVPASSHSPSAVEVQNSSVSEGGGVAVAAAAAAVGATSSTTSDGHSPNASDLVPSQQLAPPTSGSPSAAEYQTTRPGPNSQSSGKQYKLVMKNLWSWLQGDEHVLYKVPYLMKESNINILRLTVL